VQAQVIYKCRDGKGAMVYQNAACPPDSKAVQAKAYDTGQPSNAALWRAYNAKKEMDARNQALHNRTISSAWSPGSTETERDKQKRRCKAARETEQRAISNGSSAEYRAGLTRAVIDACFGL
jgi:hypothetical protein